jgi:sterol desaturase/sphingolipid hydroxylase (fatty acid hydroxylase superfamily)
LDGLFTYIAALPANAFGMFGTFGHFLGPIGLAVASVLVALHLAWRLRGKHRAPTLRRLRRLIFPRRIWLHRSALNDWGMVLINQGMLFFALGTALLAPDLVAVGVVWVGWEVGLDITDGQPDLFERIAVSIWFVLVWDFAATLAHYLKHRVPLIWEFHKVHHSAEVLTPVTALRRHPGELIFGGLVVSLCIGIAMGLWLLVFGYFAPYAVFGAWAGIWLWRVLIYNLRHSHVPVSFGPFWSYIFFSPLQHQIHHGNEPHQQQCNYGHILSVWDALLGTLHVPGASERVRFGLGGAEAHDYRSLQAIYLLPLRKVWMLLWRKNPRVAGAERNAAELSV